MTTETVIKWTKLNKKPFELIIKWEFTSEMGKLSKLLMNTIVCMSVNGQDDPTFQVTSCNADVSIKIG